MSVWSQLSRSHRTMRAVFLLSVLGACKESAPPSPEIAVDPAAVVPLDHLWVMGGPGLALALMVCGVSSAAPGPASWWPRRS